MSGAAAARTSLAGLLATKGIDGSQGPDDMATAEEKLVAAKDARQAPSLSLSVLSPIFLSLSLSLSLFPIFLCISLSLSLSKGS